jgi:hypothetical protein
MKRKKRIITLLAVALAFGNLSHGQVGALLLQKRMEKKAKELNNTLDESMSEKPELYLDDNKTASVTHVPDGTKKITLNCKIPSGAADLKKMGMQREFEWSMKLTIISNSISSEAEGEVLMWKESRTESWKEYLKSNDAMSFEIEETDIRRHFIKENGDELDQELKVQVDFKTNSSKGWVEFASGEFTIKCDGPSGKWASGQLAETIEEFKTGRFRESNTTSAPYKRMLQHCRDEWPDEDIVHLQHEYTTATEDGTLRLESSIWVLVQKKDYLMHYYVAIWENQRDYSLSNFVPQHADQMSPALSEKLEEIRNVK